MKKAAILAAIVLLLVAGGAYAVQDFLRMHGNTASQTASAPEHADPTPDQSPYGFTVAAGIDQDLVERYKQLGIYWVRLQLPWNHVETSPTTYNWSLLDQQVQTANQNGLKVSYVLQGAPSWHLTQICPANGQPFLPGPNDMRAFADAVSERYNGSTGSHGYIDSYEVGNEEYTAFNKVKGDPAANDTCRTADFYVPVLKAAYQIIKHNSPRALVGMFGPAWESNSGMQIFFQRMYDLGAKPYFDFANLHYYNDSVSTNGDPTEQVPGQPDIPTFHQRWQTVYRVMQANGDGAKSIWITEVGWHVTPRQDRPNGLTVDPQTQAVYMQDVLTDAYESKVVKKLFWYTINTANSLYHDHSADIYPNYPTDNTPLPAFQTYKEFISAHASW